MGKGRKLTRAIAVQIELRVNFDQLQVNVDINDFPSQGRQTHGVGWIQVRRLDTDANI